MTKGEQGFYRRFYGGFSILAGIVSAILSGFGFYNPESAIIWALFSAGFILLGIGNITDIWKTKAI